MNPSRKSRYLLPTVLFLGGVALAVLGLLIVRGVQRPQNAVPSQAAGNGAAQTHFACADVGTSTGNKKVNDNASAIKYKKWGYKNSGGGTDNLYQKDYHFAPNPLGNATENVGASATLNFRGNQVSIGVVGWYNRGFMKVVIDDLLVDEFDTSTGQIKSFTWKSPILACGDHVLKIQQSDKKGLNGGRSLAIDFISYRQCDVSGALACAQIAGQADNANGCTAAGPCPTPGSFLTCQSGACALSSTATATDSGCLNKNANDSCPTGGTAHLLCKNNACAFSDEALSDDPSCAGKTAACTDCCGGPQEVEACQGNVHASAKCFDCKRDATASSQVNILDYACFSKFYSQDVGTQ